MYFLTLPRPYKPGTRGPRQMHRCWWSSGFTDLGSWHASTPTKTVTLKAPWSNSCVTCIISRKHHYPQPKGSGQNLIVPCTTCSTLFPLSRSVNDKTSTLRWASHQSNRESPYLLKFGQKPQLPVEFFLGCIWGSDRAGVSSWILEHWRQLKVAFDCAQERMEVVTQLHKERVNRHFEDDPIEVRQLVFFHHHSIRGCNKIQDAWSPEMYQVHLGTCSTVFAGWQSDRWE